MLRRFFPLFALGLNALAVPAASAHYNMLLPESAFARRGQAITLVYQWGHPYEHQLFDAPRPESLWVVAPDGQQTELTNKLEKTTVAGDGGKPVTAYRLRFTPHERGDFVFLLQTPPIWMEEEQQYFQDLVKVVLHVQVQKGWDREVGESFQVVPLTRPYGLEAGMAFQAQVLTTGRPGRGRPAKPAAGGLVEVERYNARRPAKLPPDEFITRTARADPNGVVTATLPEAGWWAITGQQLDDEQRDHQGKMYPVLRRCTLWIPVAAKLNPSAK
ncbi:MAG TPA: DUF4198 domain-containing protein [Gemmataceae bacterium]|nr:DUF4198 domain-containing protein [Gemmataceae bacterium]